MTEELVVHSPYDGSEVGRVRAHSADDVANAVRIAHDALTHAPLPQWRRAEILETSAAALKSHEDELTRTIAAEAAKPIKTARVEAQRAVSTFTFAAVEARTLTGEMVPIEASDVGEGKLAFTLRVPIGVVGAISPFNFPLNLVAHKVAPAHRRRLPGGAQAREPDAAVGPRAARLLHRRVRPARPSGCTWSPARGGAVGDAHRRPSRHRDDHLHRLARRRVGHPRRGGRARRSASSSATTHR